MTRLTRRSGIAKPSGPVVLLVLDGVGVGSGDAYDAVALAKTPSLDALRRTSLVRNLRAHGTAVGMPSDTDMGNSEVGHNILGAGRILPQGAKLVRQAIESGSIWGESWSRLIEGPRRSGGTLHLLGLLSDGNVHSHEEHLHAILRRAAQEGIERVRVHILLDGRDVPPQSALIYVGRLEAVLGELRGRGLDYRIASGGGRMLVTMDRYEADWRIVQRGWETHVRGLGKAFASAAAAIEAHRRREASVSDQYLDPFVVVDAAGQPVGKMRDGDAVLLFNFRGDRAIEIAEAFDGGPEFRKFERVETPRVHFVGMMLYDGDRGIPQHYLIAPPPVEESVSELLAAAGIRQMACAETQKFGHVTYFWNGNRSQKFDAALEDYVEIPSDQVPFDQAPRMKAGETGSAVTKAIASRKYDFIRANFAGGDMVGHTGSLPAAIVAMEAIDEAIGGIAAAVERVGGTLVITADHGNAEDMVERDKDGTPLRDASGAPLTRTSHTLSPVPFLLHDYGGRGWTLRPDLAQAGLANVAATLLELLGYEAPSFYEPSLVVGADAATKAS